LEGTQLTEGVGKHPLVVDLHTPMDVQQRVSASPSKVFDRVEAEDALVFQEGFL